MPAEQNAFQMRGIGLVDLLDSVQRVEDRLARRCRKCRFANVPQSGTSPRFREDLVALPVEGTSR